METTSSPTGSARSSRRSSVVGISAWLALAALQLAAAFAFSDSGGASTQEELIYDYEFAIGGPIIYGILVALTFAIAAAYGNVLEAVGLRRFQLRWIFVALGVVIGAVVIGAIFQTLVGVDSGEEQGILPETWRPDRLPALVLNTLVTVTVVPFAEELFYRGLGVRVFRVFGALVAIAVTAIVFGLAHGILLALPILVPFAAGLAWVRLRSDSVWPGVIAHGSYNGLVIGFALLALAVD